MDFEFSEQQKMFKQTVEGISRMEIEPLLAKLPPDDYVPREDLLKVLKRFQPLGVLGAGIPPDAGGSGLDKVSLGIVAETLPPSVSIPL
ncbi:MAG: acyl-CoA dehydrogenase family protein, partial [Chloroflexota bacterium]